MRRKWKIVGLLAIIALMVAGVFLYLLLEEPSYQGRKFGDWISELNSTHDRTREAAEWAVSEIGPSAVPFLKKNVSITALTEVSKTKEFITSVSRYLPKEIGRSIRRKWGVSGGYMAGSGAIRALAKLKEDAKEAVPDLFISLDDPDPNVRSQAASALVQIAPQEAQLMRSVISKVAKDKESWVFSNLSNSAQEIARTNPDAEALLLEAIQQSKQDSTRLEFIKALGEVGKPKTTTVIFLENVLHGTNELQRLGAAIALSHWQSVNSEVIAIMAEGLSSADLWAKINTAKRLMELKAVSPTVEAGMSNLLSQNLTSSVQVNAPFWLRGYALNYFQLTGTGTNTLPPFLTGNLNPQVPFYDLRSGLSMFAKIVQIHPQDRLKVNTVLGYLASPSVEVRMAVIKAYARFCEDDPALSLALLENILKLDSGYERFAAAEAIAKLDPQNAKLQSTINKWLRVGGYATKLEAVRVIQTRSELVIKYQMELRSLTKEKGERLRKAVEVALAVGKK